MCGCVQVHVGGEHAKVVEVVRGTRIVPIRVLELAKVVQRGYLLEGELQKSGGRSARQIERVGSTHIIVVLQISQILVLVLSQSLCDVWVLDYVEYGLCFLLQLLIDGNRLLSLCSKF